MEEDIKEVAGIVVDTATNKRFLVSERESSVLIDLMGHSSMQMSPANAHRLARQIHHLATRVENNIDRRLSATEAVTKAD
jgi:hypothetical protein